MWISYLLACKLTIPLNESPPDPAFILITGSYASNRDHVGDNEYPINQYRPFRQIADALSRRGIVVFRMDDRGYGCSEGGDVYEAIISERADDTKAGFNYLRGRKEIDGNLLGLLGLSEVVNIGPMIAAENPSIRALVIVAGSATNGREILEWQVRYNTALIEGVTDEERERIWFPVVLSCERILEGHLNKNKSAERADAQSQQMAVSKATRFSFHLYKNDGYIVVSAVSEGHINELVCSLVMVASV